MSIKNQLKICRRSNVKERDVFDRLSQRRF